MEVISDLLHNKWKEDRRPGSSLSNSRVASLREEIMATGVEVSLMEEITEIMEVGGAGQDFNFKISPCVNIKGRLIQTAFSILLDLNFMPLLPYTPQPVHKYKSSFCHHGYYLLLLQRARIYFGLYSKEGMQLFVLHNYVSIHLQ